MLRDYLNEKGISIYSLARDSGISYSTLNDLVNGKVEIGNCRISLLRRLAYALDMSLDDTYLLCSGSSHQISNSYDKKAAISVRNKSYYAELTYDDEVIEFELCKVNEDTSYYIEDIARWRTEDYIRQRRMEEFE